MVAAAKKQNRQPDEVTGLIDAKTAAKLLGISDATLSLWRVSQRINQPPFYRIGTKIIYRIEEVDAWRERQRVQFA